MGDMVEKVAMGIIATLTVGWAIAQVVAAILISIGAKRHEEERERKKK